MASAICVAISDTRRGPQLLQSATLSAREEAYGGGAASFVDVVPDRKDQLFASSHFTAYEAVEFVLGPAFREEGAERTTTPKRASGQSVIDLAPKAVSDLEFVLVVPDSEAATSQVLGQWPDNLILVLGGVRDEHVEVGAQFGPSSACTSSTAWRYICQVRHALGCGQDPGLRRRFDAYLCLDTSFQSTSIDDYVPMTIARMATL